jgi:hypothetical protein
MLISPQPPMRSDRRLFLLAEEPSDAKRTDIISSVEFAKWFTLGTVATNGAVDPADSLNFRGTTDLAIRVGVGVGRHGWEGRGTYEDRTQGDERATGQLVPGTERGAAGWLSS